MGFSKRDTEFSLRTDCRNLLFLRLSTLLPQRELQGMPPPHPGSCNSVLIYHKGHCWAMWGLCSILRASMAGLSALGIPVGLGNERPWNWTHRSTKQIKRGQHRPSRVKTGKSRTRLFFSKVRDDPMSWFSHALKLVLKWTAKLRACMFGDADGIKAVLTCISSHIFQLIIIYKYNTTVGGVKLALSEKAVHKLIYCRGKIKLCSCYLDYSRF